jgi:hypothetical protein
MSMVLTVGVIISQHSFPTNDIDKAILETMRLLRISGNPPDFDLHQRSIQLHLTSVNHQLSPWHLGYLTPYVE